MIDIEMLDDLAHPGPLLIRRPLVALEDVFTRVVADGWQPRNPAYGAELDRLERSWIRGSCIDPLLIEGDEVYLDPTMPAAPGDLVSFALSARGAAVQNSGAIPGQPIWRRGDRWIKLYARKHDLGFLLDRYGTVATTTVLGGESPDDEPHVAPVRNIRRGGRLLFAPDSHAGQIGANAATAVVAAITSSAVSIAQGDTLTSMINAAIGPFISEVTLVITVSGTMTITNGGSVPAPSTNASWAILDTSAFTVGGSSQGINNIAAGSSGLVNMMTEATVTLPINTEKTYSFQCGYASTGDSVTATAIGVIKLEAIKR